MRVALRNNSTSTYPTATGDWRRVLTRSNGWNMIVEQVPLNEPARNDFTKGDWKKIQLIYLLTFHIMVNGDLWN